MANLPGPFVDDHTLPLTDFPGTTTLGMAENMILDSTSSSVVTLKPYVANESISYPPLPQWKNRPSFSAGKTGKTPDQREVLPGIFEPISFGKYITLTLGEERNLSDTDLFQVNRDIVKCIGRQPKISRVGDNQLLIEVCSSEESDKLQKLTNVNGCRSDCAPHRQFNQCKGVIYCRDLIKYSEEKLLLEFESQNVVEVRRIKKKENGELCPTPLLVLTFNQLSLPETISAAWYNLKVKPFIPSPKRCYYCQMYGHVNTSCRKRLKGEAGICVRCGGSQHENCTKSPFCFHCKGDHMASSRTCEKYLFEKEVLMVRTKERMTYKEAKNKVRQRYGFGQSSFSFALRSSSNNVNKETPVASTDVVLSKSKELPASSSSNSIPQPNKSKVQVVTFNKRSRSQDSLELPSKLTKSDAVNTPRPPTGPKAGPSTSSEGHQEGPSDSARGHSAGPMASSGELQSSSSAPHKEHSCSTVSEVITSDIPIDPGECANGSEDHSEGSLPLSLPDIEPINTRESGTKPKLPKDKKNTPLHPIKSQGKSKEAVSRKALNRESPSVRWK